MGLAVGEIGGSGPALPEPKNMGRSGPECPVPSTEQAERGWSWWNREVRMEIKGARAGIRGDFQQGDEAAQRGLSLRGAVFMLGMLKVF